jgi:hypothetical protein
LEEKRRELDAIPQVNHSKMKDFVKNSRFSSDRVCRGEGEL